MTDKSGIQAEGNKENASTSSRQIVNSIAITLFLISIVGGLVYIVVTNLERVAVQAVCEDITGGYSCTLTGDNKNSTTLNVCWSINRVCENGVKSSARKCQSIYFEPGKSSKSIFANSDFENNEKCNKVSAVAIEDVSIGTPYPQQPSASKP